MDATTLTRKGQVTIPAHIRTRLGLKHGDKVAFVEEGDKIVLVPVPSSVESAFGLLKAKKSVTLEEMERAIRRRAER